MVQVCIPLCLNLKLMTQSEIIDLLENFQKESSVNNIYNLIKYFRIKGQFKLCKLFYSTLEVDGELQGDLEGYRLRLLYEYSIFAWYLGIEHRLVIPVFMELFCSGLFNNYLLLGNYKFYIMLGNSISSYFSSKI
jgi:hypothetical protein